MPTLAQAEATLVGPAPNAGAGLVGGFLASAGYAATGTSPVAALAPAIGQALLACGVSPDDVAAPDDEDLARLAAANWPKFLDIAGLLLLEAAAFSLASRAKVVQFEDYRNERYTLADFNALLENRRKAVQRAWGYGAAQLKAGTVRVIARADRCNEF